MSSAEPSAGANRKQDTRMAKDARMIVFQGIVVVEATLELCACCAPKEPNRVLGIRVCNCKDRAVYRLACD